jgi:hypothetical protein
MINSIKPIGVAREFSMRPIGVVSEKVPDVGGSLDRDDYLKFDVGVAREKLSSLPKRNSGDQFPWELVDYFVTHDYVVGRGHPPRSLPDASDGFVWYWVDNVYNLGGVGGWLEVNVEKKLQGRFKFCLMG